MKRVLILALLFGMYIGFHAWMGGLMVNHLLFGGTLLTLYFFHPRTRLFLILALPMVFKEAVYDSLRYIPFEWLTPIHVGDLYAWDRSLFGISCGDGIRLVNECVLKFSHPFLDLTLGALYHTLNPVMFALLFVLWKLKNDQLAMRYAVAFLIMNLFAFATYILFPAAPPWYVAQHGFAPPVAPIMGDAAGLIRFDSLIGMDLSSRIYSLNPVVFGAVPSMHAGFTMLATLFTFRLKRSIGIFMASYTLMMWFAALYLQHHYLIDIVSGVAYALIAWSLIEIFLAASVNRIYGRLLPVLMGEPSLTLWQKAPADSVVTPMNEVAQ